MADGQHSEAIGAAARQRRVRGVRNIQKQNIQNKKEFHDNVGGRGGGVGWGWGGGVGGGKGPGSSPGPGRDWLSVFRARGDRRSKPAAAPRRPRIRTAGRLKTAAPSSPKLGKAGAGSQWSSREETDGVGGHRSARGGELLRRIHAVTRGSRRSPPPPRSAGRQAPA